MTVEYDLVIIGNTPEALFAAREANRFQARTALILQNESNYAWLRKSLYQSIFSQHSIQLDQVSNLATELLAAEQDSLATLAAAGIDIIIGTGEFVPLPSLAFVVKQRRLRSHAYLIATGSEPIIPQIEGLETVSYLTSLDLWHKKDLSYLPNQLTIIGENVSAIELAQSLTKRGKHITLVTKHQQLLPQEDRDTSKLLQAILEAQGIKILTASPISQIKQIEDKKWLQAGNQAIETDEILLSPFSTPNIQGLNLEAVGITFDQDKINVNAQLQTSNPRIYACGELTGNQHNLNLAQYHAKIAVNNALFWPRLTPNYDNIPWVVCTDPPLARVGLTEKQAIKLYDNNIDILQNYYKNINLAQITDQTSGLIKLIVKTDGQIVGAHIVGARSEEMIGAIALGMQTKTNLSQFIFKFPTLTMAEILHQIALEWQTKKSKPNKLIETLLTWQRRWFPSR